MCVSGGVISVDVRLCVLVSGLCVLTEGSCVLEELCE